MKYNTNSRENVRHVIVLCTVMLLSACAPTVLPVSALQSGPSGKPDWVVRKPVSGVYYIGVGYSEKSSSGNYTQSAKKNALDDLVSEISVNISSVSVLSQMDDSEGFSEQYESMIKTSVSNEIEDYELVDTWDDDTRYWVYYRLSKADYKKRQEEKRRNAIALAKDNYAKGKTSINNGNVASGLSHLINGIYALAPYLGQRNEVEVDGNSILLGSELYAEIQKTLDDIDISTTTTNHQVNMRLDSDYAIDLLVKTNSGSTISELPLTASFSVGAGSVREQFTTGDDGQATILISAIKSKENRQVITVVPDIKRLEADQENKKKYGLLLSTLRLPNQEIDLEVKKPIIYLESTEKMLGIDTDSRLIESKVKEVLTEQGFTLGRLKDKADLWVEVITDTEKGKASGSIYVTYLNLAINVIDMNTGVEINHASIDRLKAFSLDYDRSSILGYESAVKVLEKETLPSLINDILE